MGEFAGPEILRDTHVIKEFDCGNEQLNNWLVDRAWRNEGEGTSRTWVVTHNARVVAYYASSTAVIWRAQSTKRGARNQPDPLPAILLGRLGVDLRYQRQGLGQACLKHFMMKSIEVSQITGVRALLVHAKDQEIADFYLGYGFERSSIDELTLMLLVKDI